MAMVIPLAWVVGSDQRRAEQADVAWPAKRVRVGNMRGRGAGGVIDVEGEDVDTPPSPAARRGKPPP